MHPAWSDVNLRSVANQVQSHLFLAHVRASTGTAISRNNSHPYVVNNWSFMHIELIGGFEQVRQKADMLIPDALYKHRKGATDSEAFFLMLWGRGLTKIPKGQLPKQLSFLNRSRLSRPIWACLLPFQMAKSFMQCGMHLTARSHRYITEVISKR